MNMCYAYLSDVCVGGWGCQRVRAIQIMLCSWVNKYLSDLILKHLLQRDIEGQMQ